MYPNINSDFKNSHDVTVSQSASHPWDKDETLHSHHHKKRNGVIQHLKAGIQDVVGKISRSPNRERRRSPQEILEEIKPHFVKTLNPSEDGEVLRKELHQQINGSKIEDVRMFQNGKKVENQFIPKE